MEWIEITYCTARRRLLMRRGEVNRGQVNRNTFLVQYFRFSLAAREHLETRRGHVVSQTDRNRHPVIAYLW